MKKTLIAIAGFALFAAGSLSVGPLVQGITRLVNDQKKRDECYAVGVANLPSGEDQTMLQGNRAYQECLSAR